MADEYVEWNRTHSGMRFSSQLEVAVTLLHVPEVTVETVGGQELGVSSALRNTPFFKNDNLIDVLNRPKAMRHDDDRAIGHQRRDRFLNEALFIKVDARRGLVEYQDRCVLEHGAGADRAVA